MNRPPELPREKGKPSQFYYLLAPMVIVLGTVILGYYIYSGFANFGLMAKQTFPIKVLAPGSYEIELEKQGDYSIYYEYESEFQGKQYYSGIKDKHFDISLSLKATGDTIDIKKPFGSEKYTFMGRKGIIISTFNITQPGIYTFSISRAGDITGDPAVIAIGSGMFGFIGKTMAIVVGGLAILVATIALAVIIMIVIYTKRNRKNKVNVEKLSSNTKDGPKPIHPK